MAKVTHFSKQGLYTFCGRRVKQDNTRWCNLWPEVTCKQCRMADTK